MIRWLHISDVHECSRDSFHREGMYKHIVEAVAQRSEKPDAVFFTGDLAFSGKQEEYNLLTERFLRPLRDELPDTCPIFTVPGNHDVDRNRAVPPRTWMTDENERRIFQQVNAAGRQKRVDMILSRFVAYRQTENELGAWGSDWLASEDGAVCTSLEINGHRVAIIGINTAWLCQDDEDWGCLTAGDGMVDAALRQASKLAPDLTIVLGHHPLDAMRGEWDWSDGEKIRRRFEQANVIYLHGHLHRSGGQSVHGAMQSALDIQAPSGFQAGDYGHWQNGIMWGEVNFENHRLIIEPKRWNDDFQGYVFDIDAAPERFRAQNRDAFTYAIPGQELASESAQPSNPAKDAVSPPGWEAIDKDKRTDPTDHRSNFDRGNSEYDKTVVVTPQNILTNRPIILHITKTIETLISEERERLRGSNELFVEDKEEKIEDLNQIEAAISVLQKLMPPKGELPNSENVKEIEDWARRFKSSLLNNIERILEPDNLASAAVPTAIILSSGALGALIGGPVGFGAGSVFGHLITGQMKPGAAAKRVEDAMTDATKTLPTGEAG